MQCDTDLVYIKNSNHNSSNIISTNDVNIKNNEKTNTCKYCCFSLCFLSHFLCPCCKYYSAKTYVLILSLMILSSSMISSGYISAIMTSLQRQYNLNTSKIGIILSSNDIISIFSVPLISYLGAKTNRPRLMSIFSLIYVLGCGIFILPYFLGNKYVIYSSNIHVNSTYESLMYQNYDLCMINNASNYLLSTRSINDTIDECSTNNDSVWSYYIFITGQLCMSLGVSPLFTLGLTYLCDNLEERSHALYTGFLYGSYALGPALGYVMASFLLSAWVNPSDPSPTNITESDPRWVGLWWVGFLVSGGLMLFFFAFMISFPEHLPDGPHLKNLKKKSSKVKTITENETSLDLDHSKITSASVINSETTDFSSINSTTIESKSEAPSESKIKNFFKKLKGFLKSLAKLFFQIDYILLVLVISVECILAAGFSSFMVKFTQTQFQVDPSKSSILTGGVVVPSAIIGAIAGGLIVRKFDLHIEGCIRLILVASMITITGIGVLLIVKCPGEPSNGIDIKNQAFNKTANECNFDCSCAFTYSPMCSKDGITYASPCLAGCSFANASGYYNCSCLNSNNSTFDKDASIGECSRNCNTKLIIFMIILFVVIAAEGFSMTPATILVLKLVDKSLQSFALGLMKCLNVLLAYIPAPIVFSKLIDGTCILWNYDCNDDQGTCLENDIDKFHTLFLAVALGVKAVGFILLIITFIYIHKRKIFRPIYSKNISLNSTSKKNQQRRNSLINSEIALSITNSDESRRGSKVTLNSKIQKNEINYYEKSLMRRAKSSESLDTIMTNLSNTSSNISGTFSSTSSKSSTKSNKSSNIFQVNDLVLSSNNQMDIIHEEN